MAMVILLVALLGLALGYGLFKLHPIAGTIAGIVGALIVVSVMLSVVFGVGGLIAFLTGGTIMLYVTAFSTSFIVGDILGALI